MRQQYWDAGNSIFMACIHALTDRQAKLKAVKLQQKLDKMKAGAKKLIDLADALPDSAQRQDVEKLIKDSSKQAEAMKQLAEEAEDVEMVDLVTDWNKNLIFTTEKLKKQYSQTSWATDTRDTSGERPKPIFVKKETLVYPPVPQYQ